MILDVRFLLICCTVLSFTVAEEKAAIPEEAEETSVGRTINADKLIPKCICPPGPPGPPGKPGPNGKPGSPGKEGKEGKSGKPGKRGHRGRTGPAGPSGRPGSQGEPGRRGRTGRPGRRGDRGPQGIQGPVGPAGPPGPRGPRGPTGQPGNPGPRGSRGFRGDRGEPGLQGIQRSAQPQNLELIKHAQQSVRQQQQQATLPYSLANSPDNLILPRKICPPGRPCFVAVPVGRSVPAKQPSSINTNNNFVNDVVYKGRQVDDVSFSEDLDSNYSDSRDAQNTEYYE